MFAALSLRGGGGGGGGGVCVCVCVCLCMCVCSLEGWGVRACTVQLPVWPRTRTVRDVCDAVYWEFSFN